MKKKGVLIPVFIVVILGLIASGVYLSMAQFDTTLEFRFQDAVSKNWVWDSTVKLQNRLIRGFFQSDAGPIVYRFTHLEPGEATLEISAPSYEPVTVPVTLKKGQNKLEEPIELAGYEIPDLDHFIIFEEASGGDIVLEIRPVGTDSRAVLNHPCIDMWIGCRVSTQMKAGLYVHSPTDEGSVRGEEIFRGRIEWEWDPYPETSFRYSARIPGAGIKKTDAPFWVIDYLIIVPDSRVISKAELDELMKQAWSLTDPEELNAFLDSQTGRLKFFIDTSWNVNGGAL